MQATGHVWCPHVTGAWLVHVLPLQDTARITELPLPPPSSLCRSKLQLLDTVDLKRHFHSSGLANRGSSWLSSSVAFYDSDCFLEMIPDRCSTSFP